MKLIPILIAVISLIPFDCSAWSLFNKTVTASGRDITGTIKAQSISEIQTCQAITVNYTVGTPVSVTYTVPESLSKYLQVTCTNGKLKCKFQDDISVQLKGRKVRVDVVAPNVSDFQASSAGNINVTGQLKVNSLELDASSSGSIHLASVNADSSDMDASSAGSISISNLKTKSTDMDASSAGTINVSGTLGKVDVEASSAAEVKISGSCSFLDVESSSAASVDATKATIATGRLKASSGGSISVSEATNTDYQTSKSSGGSIKIR